MNALLAWFKSRNITSHTVAVGIAGFFTLYSADQAFRDVVLKLVEHHPEIAAALAAAVGIWTKYSGAHSAQGVLQEAAQVKTTDTPKGT